MIVGRQHRTICYVDCFAGPWESNSADLADTSVAVSLSIIRKCLDGLRGLGREVSFRTLFVEEKNKPFHALERYLASRKDDVIETKAKQGEFHTLVPEILEFWNGVILRL